MRRSEICASADRAPSSTSKIRLSGNFVGLDDFGGLGFIGARDGFGRIVVAHRFLEVFYRLAHGAADVSQLARPEDDQNDQQNDQQMAWRKEVHINLRRGRIRPRSKVYRLDLRIASSIFFAIRPSGPTRLRALT